MTRSTLAALAVVPVVLALAARPAAAHCQVPCGIYDDARRIAELREDVATIDKAVASLRDLTPPKDALAFNQAARWVSTKEEHASRIIATVSAYFLTQKLKPAAADDAAGRAAYLEALAEHHAVLRAAMKAKQTADPDAVAALSAAVETLAKRWEPKPAN